MTRRLVSALDYPAPLSEAAAKLREEVAAAILLVGPNRYAEVDAALAAIGITWEQAAKLKSGEAKVVTFHTIPAPPLPFDFSDEEPSP